MDHDNPELQITYSNDCFCPEPEEIQLYEMKQHA